MVHVLLEHSLLYSDNADVDGLFNSAQLQSQLRYNWMLSLTFIYWFGLVWFIYAWTLDIYAVAVL